MAARFGFRLAKARTGSQHLGMPVRYLLEDADGVMPFRNLEEIERKLSAMAQERAKSKFRPLRSAPWYFIISSAHATGSSYERMVRMIFARLTALQVLRRWNR
jgi:hypothetical protein